MFSRTAVNFNGSKFSLTQDIKDLLKNSSNPNFILIIGPARSGKSTLSNMLLNPEIKPEKEVFKTDEGNVPVTFEIQYTTVKLSEIIRAHQLPDPGFDSDLFLMDCEGLDSLGDVTLGLRKAICTFLQISSVNLFVTKTIDRTNIFSLKAFFMLPQLIPGSQRKLDKSIGIVLTGIGVPGKPSEEEFEQKRREHDKKQLDLFLPRLEEQNIKYDKSKMAFFAQPKWDRPNHYFESIKDLIRFVVKSLQNRVRIPGENLIDIFEKCVPIIQKINELDNPDIRLEIIVEQLIKSYFQQAFDYALNMISQIAQETITNKSAEELIKLSKTNYIEPIENTVLETFDQKSNEVFENITDLFPEKYNNYREELKEKVHQIMSESFSEQCKQTIIPYITNKIITDYQNEIQNFFANQTSESLRTFDVEEMLNKYQTEANDSFYNQLKSISENLTSGDDYVKYLSKIQKEISDMIKQGYKNACHSKPPYPRNLEEARRAGQEGNVVTIYPENAHGKCAAFLVTENNDLTIEGMSCVLIKLESKDSLDNIKDKKSYSINATVNVNNLTIKPEIEILQYKEVGYRRKPEVFHHLHHKYFIEIIKISLPEPFCFLDETSTYEIGSHGKPVAVKPISFTIT